MSKKLCKIMPPVVQRFLNGTRVYSKDEVIAMLTEIQMDISHGVGLPKDRIVSYADGVDNAVNIIQHKINQLRSAEDVEI